jgi:4,5-DOPA dioxygenase extradiol
MKMPVVVVGHGSPMNIVADNNYTRSLHRLGKTLPRPEAVLVISAHWQTRKTQVTSAPMPPTIYDFFGFPRVLYQAKYDCPGSVEKAALVQQASQQKIRGDERRGLDHAAWAVLTHMYPEADVPVMELSLDVELSPGDHYKLGKELAPLRHEGILIVGSGNLVHNLSQVNFEQAEGGEYDWAVQFDQLMEELLENREHQRLIEYERLPGAHRAIPTNEHYLPMLYSIALQEETESLRFFCKDIQNGSIAMRSFVIGA